MSIRKAATDSEIIVISDDEPDNPFPRNKRPVTRERRSLAELDNNTISSPDTRSFASTAVPPIPPNKRPKIVHLRTTTDVTPTSRNDDLSSINAVTYVTTFPNKHPNRPPPLTIPAETAKLFVSNRISVPTTNTNIHKGNIATEVPGHTPSTALPKANLPPLYYDAKLKVHMYRGPGYEKFPVTLSSMPHRDKILAKWNTSSDMGNTNLEDQLGTNTEHFLSNRNNIPKLSDLENRRDTPDYERRCLEEVLEVFPKIDPKFVLLKIRTHSDSLNAFVDGDIQESLLPGNIIEQILEMDDYPRQKPKEENVDFLGDSGDGTGITIKWDRNILKNSAYLKDAVILLAQEFTHVPTWYINTIITVRKSIYDAYMHIHQIESTYYTSQIRPYSRTRHPRKEIEKKYSSRKGHQRQDLNQYELMVNELQAAKQHTSRETIKADQQKQKDTAEATNLAAHVKTGALIECQCCFDDEIPANRVVTCRGSGSHAFCFECVARLAETQIGSMKHEMLCMDNSGCKEMLSMEDVSRAVPTKTLDRLAFNQQQYDITAANIEGLEQCPFCDFKAICEPIHIDKVFSCQNPDCGRETCRRCKEDSHLPKSCEEVKAVTSIRRVVEEARSAAMMRECPKCKVKIVKEDGCNKMRCTSCGCFMCYVCRADISNAKNGGYGHFNHQGGTCPLTDEQNENLHDIQADLAEKEAIAKAKLEYVDTTIDESSLKVGSMIDQKVKKTGGSPPGIRRLIPPQALLPPRFAPGVMHPLQLPGQYVPPANGFPIAPIAHANLPRPPLRNADDIHDEEMRQLQDLQELIRNQQAMFGRQQAIAGAQYHEMPGGFPQDFRRDVFLGGPADMPDLEILQGANQQAREHLQPAPQPLLYRYPGGNPGLPLYDQLYGRNMN